MSQSIHLDTIFKYSLFVHAPFPFGTYFEWVLSNMWGRDLDEALHAADALVNCQGNRTPLYATDYRTRRSVACMITPTSSLEFSIDASYCPLEMRILLPSNIADSILDLSDLPDDLQAWFTDRIEHARELIEYDELVNRMAKSCKRYYSVVLESIYPQFATFFPTHVGSKKPRLIKPAVLASLASDEDLAAIREALDRSVIGIKLAKDHDDAILQFTVRYSATQP